MPDNFNAYPSYVRFRNWRDEIPALLNCIEDDGIVCSISDALISHKWGYDRNRRKTRTRTDAIQKIVSLVQNPEDLLDRKMITRDILFRYLTSYRPLVFAGQLKSTLRDVVLQRWGFNQRNTSYAGLVHIHQNININGNFNDNDLPDVFQLLHIGDY
ncbi:unnamed protein product [Larinioides sclopetarius]|uniref:Uncharacterized protein n=1 Tax=Larinioides sclopetarius TaxID=280406 RepID=A0AAV2A0E8_9ARAC